MTWNGDISHMGHLADRIGDLAGVASRVAAKVSDKIASAMQTEFDEGVDPYGDPWEPLAEATVDRGRTPPPLTDTATMRGTLRVAPMPRAGVQITIAHPAAPHQTGWSGPQGSGPARPILPARGELPQEWQIMIEDEVRRDIARAKRRA